MRQAGGGDGFGGGHQRLRDNLPAVYAARGEVHAFAVDIGVIAVFGRGAESQNLHDMFQRGEGFLGHGSLDSTLVRLCFDGVTLYRMCYTVPARYVVTVLRCGAPKPVDARLLHRLGKRCGTLDVQGSAAVPGESMAAWSI